jgi:hypothetical protein
MAAMMPNKGIANPMSFGALATDAVGEFVATNPPVIKVSSTGSRNCPSGTTMTYKSIPAVY